MNMEEFRAAGKTGKPLRRVAGRHCSRVILRRRHILVAVKELCRKQLLLFLAVLPVQFIQAGGNGVPQRIQVGINNAVFRRKKLRLIGCVMQHKPPERHKHILLLELAELRKKLRVFVGIQRLAAGKLPDQRKGFLPVRHLQHGIQRRNEVCKLLGNGFPVDRAELHLRRERTFRQRGCKDPQYGIIINRAELLEFHHRVVDVIYKDMLLRLKAFLKFVEHARHAFLDGIKDGTAQRIRKTLIRKLLQHLLLFRAQKVADRHGDIAGSIVIRQEKFPQRENRFVHLVQECRKIGIHHVLAEVIVVARCPYKLLVLFFEGCTLAVPRCAEQKIGKERQKAPFLG